eukprot:6213113-Pleurochrysis_carterae.AAC.4
MSCAGRCARASLPPRMSSAARLPTRGSARLERLRARRGDGFASGCSPFGSPGSVSTHTAVGYSGARFRSDAKRGGVIVPPRHARVRTSIGPGRLRSSPRPSAPRSRRPSPRCPSARPRYRRGRRPPPPAVLPIGRRVGRGRFRAGPASRVPAVRPLRVPVLAVRAIHRLQRAQVYERSPRVRHRGVLARRGSQRALRERHKARPRLLEGLPHAREQPQWGV